MFNSGTASNTKIYTKFLTAYSDIQQTKVLIFSYYFLAILVEVPSSERQFVPSANSNGHSHTAPLKPSLP